MIIFYTDDRIPQVFQMMKDQSTLPESTVIIHYTLFGLTGKTLHHLNPKQENFPTEEIFRNDTESDFDYYYWYQLMHDEGAFIQLTHVVGMEFLYGGMMIILVKTMDTPYRMSVTESLMLYLVAMYGLDSTLITSIEDLNFFEIKPTPFSREGAARISDDIEKWRSIMGDNFNEL